MLNGVTQLVITKIDVLNEFETIKAATHYEYEGGRHEQLPYDICNIPVNPVYKSFDGWKEDLEGILDYDELPPVAQAYIKALENHLNVPVSMISTGPERKKLVLKEIGVLN